MVRSSLQRRRRRRAHPYGPFTQAFEHLVQIVDSVELRSVGGAQAGSSLACSQICRSGLVVDGREGRSGYRTAPTPTTVTDSTPSRRRHRIVLVIDDAQWADAPTLLLLRHTHAYSGAGAPVGDVPARRRPVCLKCWPRPWRICADPTTSSACVSLDFPGDEVIEFGDASERLGTGWLSSVSSPRRQSVPRV